MKGHRSVQVYLLGIVGVTIGPQCALSDEVNPKNATIEIVACRVDGVQIGKRFDQFRAKWGDPQSVVRGSASRPMSRVTEELTYQALGTTFLTEKGVLKLADIGLPDPGDVSQLRFSPELTSTMKRDEVLAALGTPAGDVRGRDMSYLVYREEQCCVVIDVGRRDTILGIGLIAYDTVGDVWRSEPDNLAACGDGAARSGPVGGRDRQK